MPDQQGQLDGLCGVYVIINAMNLVYPMQRQDRVALFKHLITTLHRDKYVKDALLSGTYKRHLNLMLDAAIRFMRKQHRVTITVKMLFHHNKGVDMALYCQKLEAFLQHKNRAVIINLMGRLNHWSCVRAVTETSLILEDSYGYRYVRKRTCYIAKEYQTGHMITPTYTWGLSVN